MHKFIIAALLFSAICPSAYAEDKPKVLKKNTETIRARFEDATKTLEANDRMGNFEIQELMSTYTPPPPPPKK